VEKKGVIMKVLFKNLIGGYTGKADDMVIYYDRRLNKVIIRRKAKVHLTQRHNNFGKISKNLKALKPSLGYKDDFKTYTDLFMRLRVNYNQPVSNWYNLFLKMMYKLAELYGTDLLTITREQIETQALPCISVKTAVEAGLLPAVRDYQRLTSQL
jgi:hypothetical protein